MWVNLDDDDKIYVCAYTYILQFQGEEVVEYELTKEFLAPYNYHEILRTKYSAYTCKVIYELSL